MYQSFQLFADERNKTYLSQGTNHPIKRSLLNGNCETWDCTVLFYALLSSGHQLLMPARRKQLRTQPLQDSEYVDMLREGRNAITHAKKAELSDTEFHQLVLNVEMAFRGIGFSTDCVNKMKTAVLETSEVKALKDLLKAEVERYDLDNLLATKIKTALSLTVGMVHSRQLRKRLQTKGSLIFT